MSITYIIEHWHYALLFAGWTVYKFKHYLPSGTIQNLGQVGEYATCDEARVKTYRNARTEFPDRDIEIDDLSDKNGKYFIIRVCKEAVVGIVEFLFMPIPPPQKSAKKYLKK